MEYSKKEAQELDKIKDLLNKDLITYEAASSIENKVNNAINKSKKVLKDILSKQNDIDNEVNILNNAISKFENSKNVNLKDLGLKYKNRLDVLKNQYEYFSSWPDSLSHMEVDNKISETYYKYDKLLSEMYSDLNKYLVDSQDSKFKKEQMNWSMEKKSLIQEYESLRIDTLMLGANIGSLESNLIQAINNHCYNLISIFMS